MEGDVVTGGESRWRAVVGSAQDWRGLVWLQTGQVGGHFVMPGFAVGGLAGGDVVTELSH
jgi:hypothetical protein